jgi:hypothetical protein
MAIDLITLLLVVVAVAIAYRRGTIQLLLAEIGFFGTWSIFLGRWHGFADLFTRHHLPSPVAVLVVLVISVAAAYVGSRVGGLIHRMPVVLGLDGLLGVFVHALVAVLIAYSLVSVMITLDRAYAPVADATSVNAAQAANLTRQLRTQPLLAALADPADMTELQKEAAKPGGGHLSDHPSLHQLFTLYSTVAGPQLRSSHLAGIVLSIGHHVPGFGPYTQHDLPARQPSPSPSPSPSAAPQAGR